MCNMPKGMRYKHIPRTSTVAMFKTLITEFARFDASQTERSKRLSQCLDRPVRPMSLHSSAF